MPDSQQKHKPVSTAALAIGVLAFMNMVWGAQFPFTKPALEVIPPFTFTLLRFLLALAVLAPLAGKSWLVLLRGEDRRRIAVMGVMGFCIAQVAQSLALKLSLASDISLLSICTPLWIALLARLWLKERLSARGKIGFVAAMVGVLIILWPREGNGDLSSDRMIGNAVFMITGFSWAYYQVHGKAMMARHPPLATTVAAGVVGTLCITPFAAYEWLAGQPIEFTWAAVGGVVYAGVLATSVGFAVLFWALVHVRATHAAVMMYLQPLAGTLIAWLLLDEIITVAFLTGAACVVFGVGMISIRSTDHR
ncbi:MAG: DMT family transporter [Desulfobacterales bacterium]|nr:DMT family transporter [Desulfobacterales bacterium]